MIEDVRCFDETPHYPHDMTLTIDYPCSGSIECGNTREDHKPHRIVKSTPARCPGVMSNLN